MKIIVTESQMKMVIENSQKPTRISDVLINIWDKQTKIKPGVFYIFLNIRLRCPHLDI